ncbi:HlyD family efflux transporter periplasmic adaptor subunit [Actinoplanes sp. GCM10030250]|uniref:HlyD family efflux transporter periplasmic adaptor subunit n=1 Tax=Actinoplanes sp. GCM10030250 TaxID=3273376 RepID=UPI0036172B66
MATSSPQSRPAEPPPPPPAPPKGRGWRKWRARFIVLLLLAGAVLVFIRISSDRAADANRVTLDEVILTAQAVPVEPTQAGRVISVDVAARQQVRAGQRMGTIEVAGFDTDGDPKITKVNLTAPAPGIVIDVPASIGSTVAPNLPLLELYDPARMTFVAEVPAEDLPVVAPTMTAVLEAEGMTRTVHATVERVIPRVERVDPEVEPTQPTSTEDEDKPDTMQVTLVPASAAEARGLVPGMRFTGYINTVSGQPGSPRLVSLPRAGQAPVPVGGE